MDILPDGPADDGVAYLSFFVEVPEEGDEKPQLPQGLDGAADNSYFLVSSGQVVDLPKLIECMQQELDDLRMFMDIGEGTITVSETEDKDWVNNWKNFFHQFYIDDLLVTPSREEVKARGSGQKDPAYRSWHCIWDRYARNNTALYPPVKEIYHTADRASGCRNRQWYLGNRSADVWRQACG